MAIFWRSIFFYSLFFWLYNAPVRLIRPHKLMAHSFSLFMGNMTRKAACEFRLELKVNVWLVMLALAAVFTIGKCGYLAQAQESSQRALLVGNASGPIFNQLAKSYDVVRGQGDESPSGYTLLIYDGADLSATEIASLPTTESSLDSGRVLVLLNYTPDDGTIGIGAESWAAPEEGTPALAIFKTLTAQGFLEQITAIQFPSQITEIPASNSAPELATNANAYDLNAASVDGWIKSVQQQSVAAERMAAALADASDSELVSVASGDLDQDEAPTLLVGPGKQIPDADTKPLQTVRMFSELKPLQVGFNSAQASGPRPYHRRLYTFRGFCEFLARGIDYITTPARATASVNYQTVVYALLYPRSDDIPYAQKIVERQFVNNSPQVRRELRVGTMRVNYCRAHIGSFCVPDQAGCNAFHEDTPSETTLGFNSQTTSYFSWDDETAGSLLVTDYLPKVDNGVNNLTNSTNVQQGIDIGIQGSWELGLNLPSIWPSVNFNHSWGWSKTDSINISDWQSLPSFAGSSMTYDFFATGGTWKYARQYPEISRAGRAGSAQPEHAESLAGRRATNAQRNHLGCEQSIQRKNPTR